MDFRFIAFRLPFEKGSWDPQHLLTEERVGYMHDVCKTFVCHPVHGCHPVQLAMSEAILAIARLLQKFTIAMTGDRPVLPVGTLSTRPDHAPAFVLQAREAALFHPGGFPPPILPVVQPLLQI